MSKLIRISLSSKINGNPNLNFHFYNDEIVDGNKVYKDVNCARTNRNLIDIGAVSFIYNEFDCQVEFFSIVKEDTDKLEIENIIKKMYEYIVEFLNEEMNKMKNNIEKLVTPESSFIQNEINKNFESEKNSTKVSIDMNYFMVDLVNRINDQCEIMKNQFGINSDNFDDFFAAIMNLKSLTSLVNGMTVLKIKDGNIEFNSQEKHDEVINAVSSRIAVDIIERFKALK